MGIVIVAMLTTTYAIGGFICNAVDKWIELKYKDERYSKVRLWSSVILYLVPYLAMAITLICFGCSLNGMNEIY